MRNRASVSLPITLLRVLILELNIFSRFRLFGAIVGFPTTLRPYTNNAYKWASAIDRRDNAINLHPLPYLRGAWDICRGGLICDVGLGIIKIPVISTHFTIRPLYSFDSRLERYYRCATTETIMPIACKNIRGA